jgi:hypothetical protein
VIADAQLKLGAARDRVADSLLFLDEVKAAISLEAITERRHLGLAIFHLKEAEALLRGKVGGKAAPSIEQHIAMAREIAAKEGRL